MKIPYWKYVWNAIPQEDQWKIGFGKSWRVIRSPLQFNPSKGDRFNCWPKDVCCFENVQKTNLKKWEENISLVDKTVRKVNSVMNLMLNLVATDLVNVLMMAKGNWQQNVNVMTHCVILENIATKENVTTLEQHLVKIMFHFFCPKRHR